MKSLHLNTPRLIPWLKFGKTPWNTEAIERVYQKFAYDLQEIQVQGHLTFWGSQNLYERLLYKIGYEPIFWKKKKEREKIVSSSIDSLHKLIRAYYKRYKCHDPNYNPNLQAWTACYY